MRKILFILIALAAPLTALAQQGLRINELFEGRIIPQERLVDTRVRGKTLAKYQLSYYRSLRFTASLAEAEQLRQLVYSDCKGSESVMTDSHEDGTRGTGQYTYKALVKAQANAQGQKNRFLCYLEQWEKKEVRQVTVIYMEGSVESLEKLEELLK